MTPSLLDSHRSLAPGITEPVVPELGRLLRRAVLDHITSEHRRVYSPVAHVGLPGGIVASLPLEGQRLDHALRADALEAMARRLRFSNRSAAPGAIPGPLMWLTRRGTLEVQDIDLMWASAARTAAFELDHELPMVVVTRQGWRDPWTGTTRIWQRLRPPRS